MKTLNLGTGPLKSFEDEDLNLTLKQAFVRTIGRSTDDDGERRLRLYKIGLDLIAANGSIELEDADLELVAGAVKANPMGFVVLVTAPMEQAIKKAREIPLS